METETGKTNGQTSGKSPRVVRTAKAPPEPKGELIPTETSKLTIPRIETAQIDVFCEGLGPLLIKAWSKEARSDMLRKQQGLPVVKRVKDPQKEFHSCRYLDSKGRDYIPGHIIKKCLVSAGELVGVKKSLLEKVLFVLDKEVLIDCPKGPRMNEGMVRNRGRFGAVADIRFRPEYLNWGFKCKVEYHKGFLTPEAVLNLFQNAGYSCGLGEGRPQKGGENGRFKPVKWEGGVKAAAAR
jgi:hypothetical protein